MNRFASFLPLAGYFCFRVAFCAASTGIVWTWLADSDGQWRDGAPLLPVVFGFGLPLVLGWIPLTVASAFVIRPQVRRLAAWIAGLAAFALIGGHLVTDRWLQGQYELVPAVGILGLMQLSAVLVNVSEATLEVSTKGQRTFATAFGWVIGAVITGTCGFWLKLPASLAVAVILFALAGLLLGSSGRVHVNPWITAERSIGRFARLFDLLRREATTRNGLLIAAALFGAVGAAFSLLPDFNDAWSDASEGKTFDIFTLGLMIAGTIAGLIAGATKWLALPSKLWQPRFAIPALVIVAAAQLSWFTVDPVMAAWCAPLAGIALGMVWRLVREMTLQQFDWKGVRLPLEIDSLFGTLNATVLIVIATLTWVINRTITTPFGAAGFILVALFIVTIFIVRWLKNAPFLTGKSADEEPRSIASSTCFYLPAGGIQEYSPHAEDGRTITIVYEVPESDVEAFREAMANIAKVRRRQGGLHWRLSQNLEQPARFKESYLLESWSDYQQVLRHESEEDRAAKQRVFNLNDWDSLPAELHEAIVEV